MVAHPGSWFVEVHETRTTDLSPDETQMCSLVHQPYFFFLDDDLSKET